MSADKSADASADALAIIIYKYLRRDPHPSSHPPPGKTNQISSSLDILPSSTQAPAEEELVFLSSSTNHSGKLISELRVLRQTLEGTNPGETNLRVRQTLEGDKP